MVAYHPEVRHLPFGGSVYVGTSMLRFLSCLCFPITVLEGQKDLLTLLIPLKQFLLSVAVQISVLACVQGN